MLNLREYQTVILAALLHDIGKFLHRGRDLAFDIKGTHPEVGGQFVGAFAEVFKPVADIDLLRTLVTHHHQQAINEIADNRTRNLAYLINKADVLSSKERGEATGDRRDYKTTPLVPVFHRVLSSPDAKSVSRYHPFLLTEPQGLTESALFPEKLYTAYRDGELESTIKAFGERASNILKRVSTDFNTITSHILALLQSCVLAVPANTQEAIPDTSLYDHMKTTSAVAACLYQFCDARNELEAIQEEDETASFILLVGDVSGIQRYVFEIAEKDRSGGGVAKRLRARSLFVQLISEAAPLQILEKFSLPLMNILMSSGGKFYLLLPALPDSEKRLEDYRRFAEDWFLQNLNGALGLNLAWVPLNASGMAKGFGETIRQAMKALEQKKEQGFSSSLIENNKWNKLAFVLQSFGKNERACPSCKMFGAPETDLCEQCQNDVEWGKTLPDAECVSINLSGDGPGRNLLGTSVSIGNHHMLNSQTSLVMQINNPETTPLVRHPAAFRYLARHVPRENGQMMDFLAIANRAHGRRYLGFLKADVDNLGGIFAFGLRGEKGDEQWDTPSRIATLSRQLDLFFTGWVEHLLETEFQDCYCVFSGGDDLFIIGPWNQTIDFATRLRDDFTRYTCSNAQITLSAGIVIESHSYPVGQAADDARDTVEKAKQEGRNRFTILGHTLTWGDWADIKRLWEKLREEEISSAFLYSLLDYGRMWHEYSRHGNVLGLRFQPLLAYNIKRNLKPLKNPEMYAWAERLLEWRPGATNKALERDLNHLGLIAQLLILWKGG